MEVLRSMLTKMQIMKCTCKTNEKKGIVINISRCQSIALTNLGEGAHKHINIIWIDSIVLADTSASGPQGSDGMSLININICLILLAYPGCV